MFDKTLAYHIEKLLLDYEGNYFKTKDIAKALKIKKHKYKDLMDTLYGMSRQRRIRRKDRTFGIENLQKPELIVEGIFDARSLVKNRSFAFVSSPEGDLYISAEDIQTAYHGDRVKVSVHSGSGGRKYGRVISVVKRAKTTFAGTFQRYRNSMYLVPDNGKIHTHLIVRDANGARSGQKVVMNIINWGSRELQKLPIGDITQVLGESGNPEVEILAVIMEYGLPLEFPEEVIDAAQAIDGSIKDEDIASRTDLRDLLTITIDPLSARDYDDAISLVQSGDEMVLYVHIADVAHYVVPGSPLYKEACERGNSYYFPRRVIPMLPTRLSNQICSLRPDEDKLALTVETHFSASGSMSRQTVYESVIRSDARLVYEQVDALFDGEKTDISEPIAAMLTSLHQLSKVLAKIRQEAGYLTFSLPESEYEFDDDGHLINIHRSRETDSHRLIENCMLVANQYICQRLSKGETLYRIHEDPNEDRINVILDILRKYNVDVYLQENLNKTLQHVLEELKTESFHRVFDRQILRSLKRARYSIENKGHFGLAMTYYTHFTSPIRRLCDLVVHLQIKDQIHHRPPRFTRQELFDLAGKATEREMIADESEREVDWKNKRIFMKKKLGDEFSGIILAVQKNRIVVELDDYPVSGVIEMATVKKERFDFIEQYSRMVGRKTGKILGLTDKVTVMVSKVTDDIYFQLIL